MAVPILKEGNPIGVIGCARREVRPFTSGQIGLVKTFADQAVIAIENVRLFEDVQARTRELTEALEQQTATSEVLRVISSSPGELQPVFDALLANATRLCEASYGTMWLREGDAFRSAALHGPAPPEHIERWRSGSLFRPGPDVPLVQAIKNRQPVQVADLRATNAYLEGDPVAVAGVDVAGTRTLVAVPMFKDNEPVGAIVIYRKEVLPASCLAGGRGHVAAGGLMSYDWIILFCSPPNFSNSKSGRDNSRSQKVEWPMTGWRFADLPRSRWPTLIRSVCADRRFV
jgi:GAF domain-containing protein